MFELLSVVIFTWLLVKSIGLAFRLSWGLAKISASVLILLAVPALVGCVLFVGGIALVIPIVVVSIAFGILQACV